MSDQIRIKVLVETGFAGGNHEDEIFMDRTEWEAKSEEERNEFLNESAIDLRDNYVGCSAWVAKDGEE